MISYLQVENLSKSFGDLTIFENITFAISKDQKVALIAKNGAGKTTLMRIIAGDDTPDSGEITYRNDLAVGYLSQNPILQDDNSILEEVFYGNDEISEAILEYEAALESNDTKRMQKAMEQMDIRKAWDVEVRAKQILSQLKIFDFAKKIKELSGGQQKRVALAKVLIKEPDFLILDEPTNHLDLDMIEWLEEYLEKTKSTLLMVTHDRYFLDRVCNDIIELDDNQLFRYKGSYSYYLEKREERIANSTTQVEKARGLMKKELEWIRRMPKARGTKAKYRVDAFEDLKKKAAGKGKEGEMQINVKTPRLGKKVLNLDGLTKSFDTQKIIDEFTYKFAQGEKVGIIGENGTGKSTFLNMITGLIPADKGIIEIGDTVKFGYYRQDGIQFNDGDKVIDAVQDIAEVVQLADGSSMTVSQFLTYFMFPHKMQQAYIEKLSGGEKRRLYLLTVLMQNPNFLILDEPTNDLDIMTLNVLEDYLQRFSGCLLIVSHDRYFMDKIVDHVFVFKGEGRIKDFPGNYTIFRLQDNAEKKELREKEKAKEVKPKREKVRAVKRSYKEQREFEQLELDIESLGEEKAQLENDLGSGSLSNDEIIEKSNRIQEVIVLLDEKEMRWLELSEIGA